MQPKNLPQMLLCIVYCHQKAKYYKHITFQQLDSTCWKRSNLRESPTTPETDYCIDKRMIKVKTALKGRLKNDSKDCTYTQSFFNSLSSQIKSDDIPSGVKLGDVNNTDISPQITLCCCNRCGEMLKKLIKMLQCKHRFCLNCLAAYLSEKMRKNHNVQHVK